MGKPAEVICIMEKTTAESQTFKDHAFKFPMFWFGLMQYDMIKCLTLFNDFHKQYNITVSITYTCLKVPKIPSYGWKLEICCLASSYL